MSPIRGWLTPEARAGLDAVLAKWAAPGIYNPADQTATVDGTPGEQAVAGDGRGRAQRNHDALNAACEIWHSCWLALHRSAAKATGYSRTNVTSKLTR